MFPTPKCVLEVFRDVFGQFGWFVFFSTSIAMVCMNQRRRHTDGNSLCRTFAAYDLASSHWCLQVADDMIDGVPATLVKGQSCFFLFLKSVIVLVLCCSRHFLPNHVEVGSATSVNSAVYAAVHYVQ